MTERCASCPDKDLLLDHLKAAREAIASAQSWADRWKDHAFSAKARAEAAEAALLTKDQEIAGLNLQLDAWRAAYGRVAHGRP